jgi:hypothetical protein
VAVALTMMGVGVQPSRPLARFASQICEGKDGICFPWPKRYSMNSELKGSARKAAEKRLEMALLTFAAFEAQEQVLDNRFPRASFGVKPKHLLVDRAPLRSCMLGLAHSGW